jgi:hypothetical protein
MEPRTFTLCLALALTAAVGCAGPRAGTSLATPTPSATAANSSEATDSPAASADDAPDLDIDPAVAEEVERRIVGLFMDDPDVRADSARALSAFGADARTAAGVLTECVVRDDDDAVAAACAGALAAIGPGALPSLGRIVDGQSPRVALLIDALAAMGPEAAPLVARAYTRSCARLQIGSPHPDADRQTRDRARAAIDDLGAPAADALAALTETGTDAERACAAAL